MTKRLKFVGLAWGVALSILAGTSAQAQEVMPTVAIKYDGIQQGGVSLGVIRIKRDPHNWFSLPTSSTFLQVEPGRNGHRFAVGAGRVLDGDKDFPVSAQLKATYFRSTRNTGEMLKGQNHVGAEVSGTLGAAFAFVPITGIYAGVMKQVSGPTSGSNRSPVRSYVGAAVGFGAH